jgi:hypothetical protein
MDLSEYQHSDSITIDRPPADVYAIVSDITRMGELSPVATSGDWDDPSDGPKKGTTFKGHNAIGDAITWTTHCEVVAADPGREFAFVNRGQEGDMELVRWGYTFEPDGDGTKVTESWKVLPAYPDMVRGDDSKMDDAEVKARIDGMAQLARDGIKETLANLKRVAEA